MYVCEEGSWLFCCDRKVGNKVGIPWPICCKLLFLRADNPNGAWFDWFEGMAAKGKFWPCGIPGSAGAEIPTPSRCWTALVPTANGERLLLARMISVIERPLKLLRGEFDGEGFLGSSPLWLPLELPSEDIIAIVLLSLMMWSDRYLAVLWGCTQQVFVYLHM